MQQPAATFFSFPSGWSVVDSLFYLFKISDVMPLTIKELLLCWDSRGSSNHLRRFGALPHLHVLEYMEGTK